MCDLIASLALSCSPSAEVDQQRGCRSRRYCAGARGHQISAGELQKHSEQVQQGKRLHTELAVLQPDNIPRAFKRCAQLNDTSALLILQRNGPSAYQHVISALEGRRLQQEDEGLQPTSKPLYKVTGVKMLLASVKNELRMAKSKVPGKTSVMSWLQVDLSLVQTLHNLQELHCL